MLKLNSAQRGVKAYRSLPENFDGLMGLISKYQKAEADPSTVKVSYQDHTGDVIGVSDDEDLMTAIEYAEATPTRDLKLQISSRKPESPEPKEVSSLLDQPMAQLSIDDKKQEPVAQTVGNEERPRAMTARQP